MTGHLFFDEDRDGVQDPGEPDLPGVTIIVTDSQGNDHTVVTDGGGNYSVVVPPGNTVLDVVDSTLPLGLALTTANDPQTVTVTAGLSTTVSTPVGFGPPASGLPPTGLPPTGGPSAGRSGLALVFWACVLGLAALAGLGAHWICRQNERVRRRDV